MSAGVSAGTAAGASLSRPIERWQQIESEQDLQAWMNEDVAHRDSDLGFFIRMAHLLRLRQQDQDSPDPGALRGRQEMLIGDPFVDMQ